MVCPTPALCGTILRAARLTVTENTSLNDLDISGAFTGVKEIVTIPLSFETGEQTVTKIYFPYAVTVNKIRGIVMKAIADTDNGTIQGANSVGNSADGLITAVALDALNTEYSVSPTTNNTVAKDSFYSLTSAKTTVGGKVLVTLEVTRS